MIEIKACGLSDRYDEVQRDLLSKKDITQFAVGFDIAGIVKQIGTDVTTLLVGDEVVGLVPIDYNVSGCAESIILDEFDVVKKPENVSFVDAAGCIGDAVRAYIALHYMGHMHVGDTILIFDGASSFGSLVIQLAQHWGAKVISTGSSDDEKLYLDGLKLALVIELKKKIANLRNICMEETGGLGVNIVIDNGVSMFTKEEDCILANDQYSYPVPHKQDIVSCLAVGGRWITSKWNLQLDPPNSRQLNKKCASIGFLFEQAWILSSSQQGRYQHILTDIMEKVATGVLRPNIHHVVPFESTTEAMKQLVDVRVGKVVMTTTL